MIIVRVKLLLCVLYMSRYRHLTFSIIFAFLKCKYRSLMKTKQKLDSDIPNLNVFHLNIVYYMEDNVLRWIHSHCLWFRTPRSKILYIGANFGLTVCLSSDIYRYSSLKLLQLQATIFVRQWFWYKRINIHNKMTLLLKFGEKIPFLLFEAVAHEIEIQKLYLFLV